MMVVTLWQPAVVSIGLSIVLVDMANKILSFFLPPLSLSILLGACKLSRNVNKHPQRHMSCELSIPAGQRTAAI